MFIYKNIIEILLIYLIYLTFMFRLKQFRHDKGLKQSHLQDLFSCTQPTISQIENGRIAMPTNFVRILIENYGEEAVSEYIIPESNNASASNGSTAVAGNGNTITNNDVAGLIELQKGYQQMLKEKDKQIDRLLSIIENSTKK